VELRDTPEEASFRQEVHEFIAQNLPDRSKVRGARRFEDADRDWSAKLGAAGYAGLTWPKEYGGAGAPYSHQAIFLEELARAEAPSHLGVIGLGMAGPTIMAWGTPEQKERYLSKILSAEEIWCQGFSEPDAGSDLAASRTRIEDKGDHFLINGQKVWSSFAHIADFCILVGLGDPDAPRYKNLTYLIVDMHAQGVEVRPLVQITGEPEFNEIFFTDVKVPKANILGTVGDGWQVAMTTLLLEDPQRHRKLQKAQLVDVGEAGGFEENLTRDPASVAECAIGTLSQTEPVQDVVVDQVPNLDHSASRNSAICGGLNLFRATILQKSPGDTVPWSRA
jgi:alkylation response protein AidB-like acyl-CoA dehydrogenase